MAILGNLVNTAATQGNPIETLRAFLQREEQMEQARRAQDMRFVGYVLELGYDMAKIITSDPYKLAVGGIPRGSFLIMTPVNAGPTPPHFTLLRVTGVSPTPLSNQVQQTYFELHKKSMPELDVWTQSELQWGALDCDVLGMFYANPRDMRKLEFSGDVNNVVSAHRYKVFAPDDTLLRLIVNGMVKDEDRAPIGTLRTMECGLLSDGGVTGIPVDISMRDFKGCRTAMFGKTRLGKSNVVKLLAQGMLNATAADSSVGQLIFDINGEYANDNPQDGNRSLRSVNEARCQVYALTARANTPSRPLRLNFYEQPAACLEVLAQMLEQDNKQSIYIRAFSNVTLCDIDDLSGMSYSDRIRAVRKIQMYWAILNKAGFTANEARLRGLGLVGSQHIRHFDCHFDAQLRTAAYGAAKKTPPPNPSSLDELQAELEVMARFRRDSPSDQNLTKDAKPVFDAESTSLLDFLSPATGAGPTVLRAYLQYHAADAGNCQEEILQFLD